MDLENEAIQIYDHKTQTLTNHYPIIQAHQLTSQNLVPISPSCEGEDFVVSAQSNDEGGVVKSDTIPPNPHYQGGTKGGVKNIPQKGTSQENNHNNKITISLVTPLRLRFDGHITDKIEFHVLIRNLLRRISSLSYFHCGERFQVDFKELIEKASEVKIIKSDTHWFDWQRYSTRQEEWMSLGGVTGTVSYEGGLSDFILLLRLGEYVHVGKGTSFGLGKYGIL
jgi:CRISPR-associated endoribonuclease Cas6